MWPSYCSLLILTTCIIYLSLPIIRILRYANISSICFICWRHFGTFLLLSWFLWCSRLLRRYYIYIFDLIYLLIVNIKINIGNNFSCFFMNFVFFVFSDSPNTSLTSTTLFRFLWKISIFSAISIVSSAYLILHTGRLLTFIPAVSSRSAFLFIQNIH